MNSFLRGLGFGAGFAISVVIVMLVAQKLFEPEMPQSSMTEIEQGEKWRALSYEEQIAAASAIVISRYSETKDEGRVATVTEVLKDNEAIVVPAKAGDLRRDSKYYPDDEFRPRTGTVTFYTGSPAVVRSTLYLYEDRVAGYGDMPLDLLIKKFREDGA